MSTVLLQEKQRGNLAQRGLVDLSTPVQSGTVPEIEGKAPAMEGGAFAWLARPPSHHLKVLRKTSGEMCLYLFKVKVLQSIHRTGICI